MRIVVLANSDVGLYKFRRELLEFLCKIHEVLIVLPQGVFIKELEKSGCQYIPFSFDRRGINPLADLQQIKRYIYLLNKINPDLVLTYTIKPNIYGGIACQLTNVPYISNVTGLGTAIENGGVLAFVCMNLYRLGLKKAKCVFFQNKENINLFLNRGMLAGKNRLIPGSGVNLSQYKYEYYPSEKDGIRLLFVGRIMQDKGIAEILEAMKVIHKNNSQVTLDVVGRSDEDYTDALVQAEQKGIIRYHGFQKDMYKFYKNCHCVVLPSYHEGLANVLLEGAATGRPVITTRVAGCQETFTEGITGFGCDVANAISLQEAIEKFLSLSTEERCQLGINARHKMEEEFDRQIVMDAYLEEIDALDYKKGINNEIM